MTCRHCLSLTALMTLAAALGAGASEGYYRMPAIRGETVVFCAEGDLWILDDPERPARRLTTHHGEEQHPAISPDGATIAFSAQYEGPTEVYTIPIGGGLPVRQTWEGGRAFVIGYTPRGHILYSTLVEAGLPSRQLATIDPATGARAVIPLAQASDGAFDADGGTLFFTRFEFQGSQTKRYKGGTAQQIWSWSEGAEAVPLTGDFPGTSKEPMVWAGRVYFASDRDGAMNLWSMRSDGSDTRQHTHHEGLDIQSPDLAEGRIVYQLGADLWRYDIAAGGVARLPIALGSDFDQMREKWITKPMEWVTSIHPSPDGDRVALTARGQVFVAPHKQGRLIEVTRRDGVRYRDARFMPDGKTLLVLSDESGEVEFWTFPPNGVGEGAQLTTDGTILRWEGVPSPDGKWIAHRDKNFRLWLLNVETGEQTMIDESTMEDFADLTWSPDSRWLAYTKAASNTYPQVWLHQVAGGAKVAVTTNRTWSFDPTFSTDGKWLYFVSDRRLSSAVGSPWGARAPKPFFTDTSRLCAVALVRDLKFPFDPDTELDVPEPTDEAPAEEPETEEKPADDAVPTESNTAAQEADAKAKDQESGKAEPEPEPVMIDVDGLPHRLHYVPVPPGNYSGIMVLKKHLLWIAAESPAGEKQALRSLEFDNKEIEPKTLLEDITSAELTADRKKVLVRKGDELHVLDAAGGPPDLADTQVNLSGWTFAIDIREEWRQMFVEAWRLERDYFYDRAMHGVDWPAMLEKYRPMVDRVRTRAELSNLIAQMVAELSALHIFVAGGDLRGAPENVPPASLGARLRRDAAAGGWRIEHIHRTDPEYPEELSPLARQGVNVAEGDVIEQINGVSTLSVRDIGELLRNQAGRQVLLRIKPTGAPESRDVVVTPITPSQAADLRYDEWELTRREIVEKAGAGAIGYVHLRAMGGADIAQWARDFYPVFDRQGLIVDVRHNNGGNIDSWVLTDLLRKAWFYWQGRIGDPAWNMQYAFRGHIVILCDEETASDGEAITEGVRRLGLGTIIGTRTWGGEIWLSSSNVLVDRGIATAAEFGVYGPEGIWLIEGHGVEPDIVVDNLPHATFNGEDAQLAAAIAHLKQKIADEPRPVPPAPAHPDLSFPPRR